MKKITALLLALLLVMGSVLIPAAAENELFEEKAPALTEEAGEENAPEAAGAEEKEIVSPEEPEGEPAGEPAQEEEEEPEEPAEEPEEPAEEEPAPAVGGEEPAGEPEGEPEGGEPEGTPAGEPEGTPAGEPAGEPAPAEPEPAKFTEGYVLLKKNAVICSEMNPKKGVHKIAEDGYAWAKVEDASDASWLSVTYDTKAAREKDEPLKHGYVQTGKAAELTAEETEKLEKKLEKDKDAREYEGHKIPLVAVFGMQPDPNAGPDPEVSSTPAVLKASVGETARFYTTVKNADGEPAFQWQYSADEGTSWTDLAGETQSMLAFEVTEDNRGYLFRCAVRVDGARLTGPVVRLNTAEGEIVSNGPLSVKITPKTCRTTIGANAQFTAKVKNPKGETSYQWQYSKNGGKSWKNAAYAGSNTAVMTVKITSTIAKKYSFRCVVKSGKKKAVSNAASVVAAKASASPSSTNVGKKVKFKAAAYNYGKKIKYQWYYSANGGKSWKKYKGKDAKTKKITVKMTRGNITYQYRCKISTSNGKLYTNAVSVKEKPRQIAVVIANNSYRYQNQLPGVYYDGYAMAYTLNGLGWEVRLLQNVTAAQMDSAIRSAFSGSRAEDTCLVYYSGHGDSGLGSSAGSLCGINCTGSTDLYSPASMRNTLLSCTKGKVIIMLDSCGSGAGVYANSSGAKNFTSGVLSAFKGYLMSNVAANTGEFLQNRFAVLAACEYGDTSMDGYIFEQNGEVWQGRGGVFTYSLVRSMGCSYPGGSFSGKFAADSNGDSKLSLQEAYNGIKSRVNGMNSILAKYGISGRVTQQVQMGGAAGTILFHK